MQRAYRVQPEEVERRRRRSIGAMSPIREASKGVFPNLSEIAGAGAIRPKPRFGGLHETGDGRQRGSPAPVRTSKSAPSHLLARVGRVSWIAPARKSGKGATRGESARRLGACRKME